MQYVRHNRANSLIFSSAWPSTLPLRTCFAIRATASSTSGLVHSRRKSRYCSLVCSLPGLYYSCSMPPDSHHSRPSQIRRNFAHICTILIRRVAYSCAEFVFYVTHFELIFPAKVDQEKGGGCGVTCGCSWCSLLPYLLLLPDWRKHQKPAACNKHVFRF